MDYKTIRILFCLLIIIFIGVFVFINQESDETQESGGAIIQIENNENKDGEKIIIDSDENAIIIKEGEEIIVGE